MFKGEKAKSMIDSPERLNRLVSGTKLKGDLITESNLRIDGEIIGSIRCKGKFVLGEKGLVKGDLNTGSSEIEGAVEGDIIVEDLLILRKTAVIQGNVVTSRLVIEDGAQIGGSIQTGDVKNMKLSTSFSSDLGNGSVKNSASMREAVQSDVVY
ncbi:MAG: polymer-forming cytoskeletal protein [Brumimicrobium sp.]|nr:polymer-forming cytoskeletal protein [Brumimicrobium sp.]